MAQGDINSYLRNVEGAAKLAELFRASIHADERDPYVKFVKYSSSPDDAKSFCVDVLHVRFIGRLEYVKHVNAGREFASCQYSFVQVEGKDEQRIDVCVRFLAPEHAILSDGTTIELPFFDDDEDDGRQVGRVRANVSRLLLQRVIDNLEKWSF